MGFTSRKLEEPLRDIELKEEKKGKRLKANKKSCLKRTYVYSDQRSEESILQTENSRA